MAPSVPNAKLELGENCLRVLLTGFGPSPQFEVNPSWLAVQPLHDTVIPATDDQIDCADGPYRPRSIHITALQLPVSYSGVLDIIPTLHTHPPKPPDEPTSPIGENEQPAYDFIFHIGVCGRGWLRLERQAHKTGYMMKDATGALAPVVRPKRDQVQPEPQPPNLIGIPPLLPPHDIPPDPFHRENRGFGGSRYDNTHDDLPTQLDVSRLISALRQTGFDQIYTSMDAAHYMCDFAYWLSLAEAERHYKFNVKAKAKHIQESRRSTHVLALHCPPVDQPLRSEEVTEVIKRIIVWVCEEIETQDAEMQKLHLDA